MIGILISTPLFSVTGDSGVFEAASPAKQPSSKASTRSPQQETCLLAENMDNLTVRGDGTAQILIRLKYSTPDSLLYVGVEKARNLKALTMSQVSAEVNRKM